MASFHRKEYPAIEPNLVAHVEENSDVVVGVCIYAPHHRDANIVPEEISRFARRFKTKFPSKKMLVSYIANPGGITKNFPPIPPEVEMVDVQLYGCMSPERVRYKVSRDMNGWIQRAGERPMTLRWISDPGRNWTSPLDTSPNTFKTVADLALEYGLQGLVFDAFGSRPDGWAPGILARSKEMKEIESISNQYGFGKSEANGEFITEIAQNYNLRPKKMKEIESVSSSASKDDWITLFDGKSLDRWRGYPNGSDFSVEDGELRISPTDRSMLYFTGLPGERTEFTDLELETQFKLQNGANSGLVFHTGYGSSPANSGLEVQLFTRTKRIAATDQITGAIFKIAPSKVSTKDGSWCDLRIRVEGKTVTVWIDNKEACRWTEPPNWTPPQRPYPKRRIGRGTFGVQSWKMNSPGETVFFKPIRVRDI